MKTKNQAGRAVAKMASFADAMGPFGSGVGATAGFSVLDADLGLTKLREKPAVPTVTDKTAAVTDFPLARPRPLHTDEEGDTGPATWEGKNPSVVVRMDGRYGVAFSDTRLPWKRPSFPGLSQWRHQLGLGSSESSGFVHLTDETGHAVTFKTREEAEARAWRLAREIARMGDWP